MNSWSAPSEIPGNPALNNDTPPDLTRFADAVFSEGKSLLLVRSDTDALHSISQSLQALWLTRAPQLKVEHFSGRLSAGLLGLINAILAEQALPVVMQSGTHELPQHLCVVHDAECLSQDELLLLQRVIEHFPGWKTRLVLLFKTALDTSEKLHVLLQHPGKGLVIWQLDAPTSTQPSSPPPVHHPKPHWLIGLVVLTLLGSAWVLLPLPKGTSTSPVPLLAQTPAPDTRPMAQGPEPLPAASAENLPASTPHASAAVQVVPATPTPAANNEAINQTHVTLPPVPDVAIRGHRWLSGLPGNFFVITHGSHEGLASALRQIEAKSELSTARVIMLNPTSTHASLFLVVTGPFRSLERAQNFKIRQKLPASTEIQEVSAVLSLSRTSPKAKP